MDRKNSRQSGQGYRIKITQVNGDTQEEIINKTIDVDNISKGGFRFTTNFNFEIEDRVRVVLCFPDNTEKDVLGRICYSEAIESDEKSELKAYGLSVLGGFYELAN